MAELKEKASPEVAKKMEEWKPEKMSREDQEDFVRSLSETIEDVNDYSVIAEGRAARPSRVVRAKEPWRPEYDEMSLLFLTPEEIKERQDKGMAKEDIIKDAKDMIVTAKWKECQKKAHESTTYFRFGGPQSLGADVMFAGLRNKRYFEEIFFSDDPVRNTLDAVARKKEMRSLMNQDINWVGKEAYIDKDVPMPRHEVEDFHPVSALKRLFQSPEKRAEEDKKREAERKEARRKYVKVYAVKKVLTHQGKSKCGIGAKSLDFVTKNGFDIDFDAMKSVAGCVDMEKKKILLNSSITHEEQALSLINAACFIKQEMNGAGKSAEDMAIRKADTLATQAQFFGEVMNPDPLLSASFRWRGNDPAVLRAYKRDKIKLGEEAARSNCIDSYLSKTLPANKQPSAEKIASICRDLDGKSYYTAQTKTAAAEKGKPQKSEAVSGSKMKALNPSFIDKMKQQGR